MSKNNNGLKIKLLIISISIGFISFFITFIFSNSSTHQSPPRTPSSSIKLATSTPTGNPFNIAFLTTSLELQLDGTVRNTANLSVPPLGLGYLQFASPKKIQIGESDIIRLKIDPPYYELLDLPTVSAPRLSSSNSYYMDHALEFTDEILIYPIMIAELKGVNFEILPDGPPEKPITSHQPVEWIWNITPKSSGRQNLVLSISIPVILDESRDVISTHPLKNIPFEIIVEVIPTPVPSKTPTPTQTPLPTFTPTPPSALARIEEKFIENSTSVFAAILVFIGGLFTVYASIQNSKRQAKSKERILEDEKEQLEQEVARLKSTPWWLFWKK